MPTSTSAALRRASLPRRALLGCLAGLICLCAAAAARADLSGDVGKALAAHASKGSTVSIQLVAIGESSAEDRILYTRSADRPMIPASNMKLLTSAVAIDTLGKDFRFKTQLLVRGDVASGEVEVAVIGDGDPSFGDAALLKDIDGWDTRTVFASWADLLRRQGVTRVTAIRLDDSVFDDERVHASWPLNQRHRWYEAQVGGLNLNLNCLDIYVHRRGDDGLMGYRLDPPTRYVTVNNTLRRGAKNAVDLTRAEGGNAIILRGQTNAREQGPLQVTVDDPTAWYGTVFA